MNKNNRERGELAEVTDEWYHLPLDMNENKKIITSMRLSEEDVEKFKKFAEENGFTQQQAFNSLMAIAELEKAKNVLSDRGKEIDTFRELATKLVNMFANSLEMNVTAEDTIREELSKELKSKDESIIVMSEQIEKYKEDHAKISHKNKEMSDKINDLNNEIKKLLNDINNNEKQINTLNSNNEMLQEQLQEFKQYKESYKNQQTQIRELTSKVNALESEKLSMKNSIELLDNMAKANKEQIEFYRSELQAKKEEVTEIRKETADNIKAMEEQYKSRLEMEIKKKDLEIGKLQEKNMA